MKQSYYVTDKYKIEISKIDRSHFSAVILLKKASWFRRLGKIQISTKKTDKSICYLKQLDDTFIPLHHLLNSKKLNIIRMDEDFTITDLVNCCKDIINTVEWEYYLELN